MKKGGGRDERTKYGYFFNYLYITEFIKRNPEGQNKRAV